MNPLQIALLAAQIASTLWPLVEPLAAKGLDALISDLKGKEASKPHLSMPDIKALADKHHVDLKRVLAFAEPAIMGLANAHETLPDGHMGLSFGSFFSSIGNLFTEFRNFLADPKTTAAIENVETVAVALVCAIANAAELSSEIMAEVGTGQSAAGTTAKIRVASAAICTALGGTLTGEKVDNVKAVTSVSGT